MTAAPDLARGEPSGPAAPLGWRRRLVLAAPYLWLALFFGLPFLIVLKLSFAEVVLARPPYTPLIEWLDAAGRIAPRIRINLDNYALLASDDLYLRSLLTSLRIAAVSTLIALAIGYPIAYAVARAPQSWRAVLVTLIILPFWTSFLIRVYAWIGILKNEGLLNAALLKLGLIAKPLVILNTDWAVYIGIVYSYLPFMVLPLYAALEKQDPALLEAAADLGAPPWKSFWTVTVPLSLPGIVAGSLLVFIPAVGEFVIPDILGGSGTLMIGKTLWSEFFNNRDWPLASAIAVVLLLVIVAPIVWLQRQQAIRAEAER
jgi:putrescine transport system permease protein